jgi:type I restriction-modification system DNA methylase subunit
LVRYGLAKAVGYRHVVNGTVFKDPAFKDIEKLEADLWEAADQLRANSKFTSSDYFMPVLGIIFLRHAANRYEAAAREIAADQAAGRMAKHRDNAKLLKTRLTVPIDDN